MIPYLELKECNNLMTSQTDEASHKENYRSWIAFYVVKSGPLVIYHIYVDVVLNFCWIYVDLLVTWHIMIYG